MNLISKLITTLLIAGIVGCAAPIQSTPSEARRIAAGEGVVVGAFYVVTAKATEDQKKNAGIWKPQVSENMTFAFKFFDDKDVSGKLWSGGFEQKVKPNKVEYFVKKLPAGSYTFTNMDFPGSYLPFSEKFTVTPGQTHYIGQFNLVLPVNLLPNTQFAKSRVNAIEEARKAIAADFPQAAKDMVISPALVTSLPSANTSKP
jgi:hypothetical protein